MKETGRHPDQETATANEQAMGNSYSKIGSSSVPLYPVNANAQGSMEPAPVHAHESTNGSSTQKDDLNSRPAESNGYCHSPVHVASAFEQKPTAPMSDNSFPNASEKSESEDVIGMECDAKESKNELQDSAGHPVFGEPANAPVAERNGNVASMECEDTSKRKEQLNGFAEEASSTQKDEAGSRLTKTNNCCESQTLEAVAFELDSISDGSFPSSPGTESGNVIGMECDAVETIDELQSSAVLPISEDSADIAPVKETNGDVLSMECEDESKEKVQSNGLAVCDESISIPLKKRKSDHVMTEDYVKEEQKTESQLANISCTSSDGIVDEEALRLVKEGNPEFTYEVLYKPGTKTEIPSYKCWKCPTSADRVDRLEAHYLSHGASKKYKCKFCDFSVDQMHVILRHEERHRSQKPLKSPNKRSGGMGVPSDSISMDDEDVEIGISSGEEIEFDEEALEIGMDIAAKLNPAELDFDKIQLDMIAMHTTQELSSPTKNDLGTPAVTNGKAMHVTNTLVSDSEVPQPSPPKSRKEENKTTGSKSPSISLSSPKFTSVASSKKLSASKSDEMNEVSHIYAIPLQIEKSTCPQHYLLSSMRAVNFMCFEEISFNLSSDAVTFSGGEGKSSSIISILLGLGYDVLVENQTPSVLCGWEISDLIRRGRDTARIEITLNLKSYPQLSEKYGDELKIIRTLRRGVALSNASFQITVFKGEESTSLISIPGLRSILQKLNIVPIHSKLLLLDKQNLKLMLNDVGSWYDIFLSAVAARGKALSLNLENLTPIFSRLEGDLNWRKKKQEFLKKELLVDYPVEEDPVFIQWKQEDAKRLLELEKELKALHKQHEEFLRLITAASEQLARVPGIILKEMREIYVEFLAAENCIGDILIDESSNKLRIWIREKNSTETELPLNATEAEDYWKKQGIGKRQLSIFGLYLSFWKVIDSSPFFAVDSYSSAVLEFKFPSKGLPLLLRLARSKSGQQFLMSFPEPDVNQK